MWVKLNVKHDIFFIKILISNVLNVWMYENE